MGLANYSELKASVLDFMTRAELTGNVSDWIALAEAKLNRELNPVETDTTLTGVIGSREIDVSALSIVEPIALYHVNGSGDETELTKKSDFSYYDTSGTPTFWEYDPDVSTPKIKFNRPLSAADTFRFRARLRFALSDALPTNWLLTNHPDVYLAASLMWGGGFTQAWEYAGVFKTVLDEGIPSVRNIIAQGKRAEATVDPALPAISRGYVGYYDGTE